mgnify:CR=1 FL=1
MRSPWITSQGRKPNPRGQHWRSWDECRGAGLLLRPCSHASSSQDLCSASPFSLLWHNLVAGTRPSPSAPLLAQGRLPSPLSGSSPVDTIPRPRTPIPSSTHQCRRLTEHAGALPSGLHICLGTFLRGRVGSSKQRSWQPRPASGEFCPELCMVRCWNVLVSSV